MGVVVLKGSSGIRSVSHQPEAPGRPRRIAVATGSSIPCKRAERFEVQERESRVARWEQDGPSAR